MDNRLRKSRLTSLACGSALLLALAAQAMFEALGITPPAPVAQVSPISVTAADDVCSFDCGYTPGDFYESQSDFEHSLAAWPAAQYEVTTGIGIYGGHPTRVPR